jgi:hypothetical protein
MAHGFASVGLEVLKLIALAGRISSTATTESDWDTYFYFLISWKRDLQPVANESHAPLQLATRTSQM